MDENPGEQEAFARGPRPTTTASADLAAALSAGDLDTATTCFARDGYLLTADATAVRGREDIRGVLDQLISMGAIAEVDQRSILVSGEVALASEHWTTRYDRAPELTYSRTVPTTLVLRRIEGHWKLQIAAPWGWR